MERILGTTWDRATINGLSGKGKKEGPIFQNSFHIPLALAQRPELLKDLQAMIGGKSQVNEEVPDDAGNLGAASKETFMDFMRKANLVP